MCDFVNTTLCRLCLNITEGQQTVDLTGDKQLCTILENVFPGMKLELIQTPKICLTCKDRLQFAHIFKNTVLCNEQKIESNKDCFINGNDMCRLCLKEKLGNNAVYLCENNHFMNQPIRTVIEVATGPLNFDSFKKPIMCTECWSLVKDTYAFKKRCFDNEDKLHNYLSKKTNNGLNILSSEEVLTAIVLKEKAGPIPTGDKENRTLNTELNTYSALQSVVNLDSNSEDNIVSNDFKPFLTCSTSNDPVLKIDSDSDNDQPDSKNTDDHSDSDCSEDLFDETINDDVVEIRIRKPKNVDDTKLNNIDFRNRDASMDVENSESYRYSGAIQEEFVKDEMSFEEHDIDFKGFSFEDESKISIRKTSLSEHHKVKLETTDQNSLSIPSVEKSLTIPLIDCVKYQSYLNMTKSTTKNEKNSQNDTGNKCSNCQKVYRNPDSLEEHIRSCERSLRKKVSLKKSSKTTRQIFKRHISLRRTNKEKRNDIEIEDDITPNAGLDQKNAEAAKPSRNSKEPPLEAFKKVLYQCNNCSCKTVFHSKYVLHLKNRHYLKFICDICQKGYKTISILKRHRLTHCEDRKFVCDICQKRFSTKYYLSKHQVRHCTERNYICDICEKAFKRKDNLIEHLRYIHCEDRNFVCDVCQKGFKSKYVLSQHKLTHCTDRKYICGVCEKSFKTNNTLQQHRVTHREDGKFGCDVCHERFQKKDHLISHQITHPTVRNYICSICEKAFKTNSHLKQHRFVHCKDGKFVCDVCQKIFKSKRLLNQHQVTHTSERNYVCDICEKSFKTNPILKQHRITHSKDGKFGCNVCQKRFKKKPNLILHLAMHRSVRNYICNICERAFKRKSNLNAHQFTHCEDRKFICDVCQKGFKGKKHLNAHHATHRTDGNYTCNICKKAFKMDKYLKQHRLTHG